MLLSKATSLQHRLQSEWRSAFKFNIHLTLTCTKLYDLQQTLEYFNIFKKYFQPRASSATCARQTRASRRTCTRCGRASPPTTSSPAVSTPNITSLSTSFSVLMEAPMDVSQNLKVESLSCEYQQQDFKILMFQLMVQS